MTQVRQLLVVTNSTTCPAPERPAKALRDRADDAFSEEQDGDDEIVPWMMVTQAPKVARLDLHLRHLEGSIDARWGDCKIEVARYYR
jgi:hypothetical protein